MSARRESDEAALADRLVNYADALVAVTFLGLSGLGIAIADPDIRCSITEAVTQVIIANLATGALFNLLIVWLRRWELDLRSGAPPSDQVAKYSRWLHVARITILWISVAISVFLANQARDSDCEVDVVARSAAPAESSSCVQLVSPAASMRPGRSPVG